MPEINLFVIGDPGYKENVLERHVAEAMDLYRSGQLRGSDGSAIALDAVVMTGDNFETDDQSFEDAVKPQFEQAFARFDVPFYITLGNHDLISTSKAKAEWKYAQKDESEGGSPRWTVGSDFSFRHYRVDLPSSDEPLVTLLELDSNGPKQVKQGAAFLQQQLDAIDQEKRPRWSAFGTEIATRFRFTGYPPLVPKTALRLREGNLAPAPPDTIKPNQPDP